MKQIRIALIALILLVGAMTMSACTLEDLIPVEDDTPFCPYHPTSIEYRMYCNGR